MLAEGAGGGDEPVPSSSKASASMACRKSAADKMLDFMRAFVSFFKATIDNQAKCQNICLRTCHANKLLLQMEKREEERREREATEASTQKALLDLLATVRVVVCVHVCMRARMFVASEY